MKNKIVFFSGIALSLLCIFLSLHNIGLLLGAIEANAVEANNGPSGAFWGVVKMLAGAAFFGYVAWKARPNQVTPDTHIRCPDCKELILKEARVCKHCGCKLVPQE